MCQLKRTFKLITKNKRKAYNLRRCKQFEDLKRHKPKDFWKYFRSHNPSGCTSNTSLNDFKNHFQQMFSNENFNDNANAEGFNSNHDFDNFDNVYGDLDNQITYSEVIKASAVLKKCKSPGVDKLLNEYFMETCDILAGNITTILT